MAGTGTDHDSVIRDHIQRLYQADADAEERRTEQRIAQRLNELAKRGLERGSASQGAVIEVVREEGLRLVARRLEITKEVLHKAGKRLDLERMALIETDIRDLVDRWASRRVPYLVDRLVSLGNGRSSKVAEDMAARVRMEAERELAVMRGEVRLAAIQDESRPREEAPGVKKTGRSSLRERIADIVVALFLAGAVLTSLRDATEALCGGEGGPVAAIISLAIAGVCGVLLSVWWGAISARKRRSVGVAAGWVACLVGFGWIVPKITTAARPKPVPIPLSKLEQEGRDTSGHGPEFPSEPTETRGSDAPSGTARPRVAGSRSGLETPGAPVGRPAPQIDTSHGRRSTASRPVPEEPKPGIKAGAPSRSESDAQPLPVRRITIAGQEDVSPGPHDPPWARKVVLHTTERVEPTWLRIDADAPIREARYGVGGGPCTLQNAGEFYAKDRRTLWFHFDGPAFTPEASVALYLFGDARMRALSVAEERPPAGLEEENGAFVRMVSP